MKILFLDDSKVRHRVANQWFPADAEIVRAHNAYECVGLYLFGQSSEAPFDLVSLDRDLGERRTGEDVVDKILLLHRVLPHLYAPHFAIHSWNVSAAKRMEQRLLEAGFVVTQQVFSPPAYLRDGWDEETEK